MMRALGAFVPASGLPEQAPAETRRQEHITHQAVPVTVLRCNLVGRSHAHALCPPFHWFNAPGMPLPGGSVLPQNVQQ